MRNGLCILLMVLVCVLALGANGWSYNRPYVLHDEAVSTNGPGGGALDDHPWGEDQSIANPNTDPGTRPTIRQKPSAIIEAETLVLRVRLYFVDMVSRWIMTEMREQKLRLKTGSTDTGTATTTNSTTVSDGAR